MLSILKQHWQSLTRAALVSYTILLMTLTHMPIPPRVGSVTSSYDKLFHFGAYFVLATLSCAVFHTMLKNRWLRWLLVGGLLAFAAMDEILQGPVGRTPDFYDWFADSVGAWSAVLIAQLGLWTMSVRHVKAPSTTAPLLD